MIYLDNAATTVVYEEANRVLFDAGAEFYFNASALYAQAVEAEKRLKAARETLKTALHAGDGAFYFTSGGTEADNTALFGVRKPKGSRIVIGAGEHDAVMNPAAVLKEQGYDVVYAPVRRDGSVDEEEFAKLLNENVSLVSVMHVSNHTGAVNDIKKLVKLTSKYAPKAVFHSDGVQAFGKIPVNIRALGVDLYSVSGHKIHAPKGIGGLYVSKRASVKPLLYGGGQEEGFRSGTEMTPLIWAFAAAVERNMAHFEENYSKKRDYIEQLSKRIVELLPDTQLLTDFERCAPHILTVALAGVRGEVMLHALEKYGILVGIGSACSSHKANRFGDLLALDATHRDGTLRFSVSEFNDIGETERVAAAVAECAAKLKEYARK